MKIENGQLRLELSDNDDLEIMRFARRGVETRAIDKLPLTKNEQDLMARMRLAVWRASKWNIGDQLELTEDTGCSFLPEEALGLSALITAGLKYPEGKTVKSSFFSSKPPEYIESIKDDLLSPDLAQEVLPVIQQFAGQTSLLLSH